MKIVSFTRRFLVAGMVAAGMLLAGCAKDDTPVGSSSMQTGATDDAVLSIAAALGDENGGASNNIGDVIALASPEGIGGLGSSLGKEYGVLQSAVVDSVYDPATGWWSITVTKEKNSASDQYYTKLARVYRVQFLKSGTPQRSWRVQNGTSVDTADVIKCVIVSGTGEYRTPHIHHLMKSLSGSFTATGTNTDSITVNSDTPYLRTGLDTLTVANAVRTLDHSITMSFSGIRGPRLRPNSTLFTRKNLMNRTTGTVTGRYVAMVTVQRGESYSEKTIDRTFTVTLSGGEGSIGINGEGRRFKCTLSNGDEKF